MVQQWDIQRTHGVCAATGKPIEEGDEFYSVLFEDGETFRRADYLVEAWEGPPENSYCHYKTRMPVKDKKKRTLVDDVMLRAFFTRLEKDNETSRIQFRFVLALILMRKRVLRYEGSSTKEGRETWTMRFVGEDVRHRVVNPRLDESQIAAVSRQLSSIMHSDMGEWAMDDNEWSDASDVSGEDNDAQSDHETGPVDQTQTDAPRTDGRDSVEPSDAP
ncbi:MAG: hypothetical protein ACYTHJ_15140 [Planctomycetota bacterium]|jgi:hypothetical protein